MLIFDVLVALAFTFGFLILLFLLIKFKNNFLKEKGSIDMGLIVIALLPFVAYLILSGKVKQLTVGDLNVVFTEEARATEVASLVPQEQKNIPLAVEEYRPFAKGSVYDLHTRLLPRLRQERFTTMVIDVRPDILYNAGAIREYLTEMGRYDFFKYVVFLEQGEYRGWMTATSFMALLDVYNTNVEKWINRRDFVKLQQEGMHTEKIEAEASALDALRALNEANQENIAVLDGQGQLVGIASRDGITSQIIAKTLLSESH
ncbi:MAG: hypothetical protein ACE5HI_03525 [bacterium]